MINLAGNKDANRFIEEELYLAGIPSFFEKSEGEVPYTIIGKLRNWTFKRAWYYHVASCLEGLGLPYNRAVELHERKYPVSNEDYRILGQSIRVNGHCGCPHPKDYNYPTLKSIDQETIELTKKCPSIHFNTEEALNRATLRELNGVRYIRLYHIDTQIGLRELANKIRGE